MTELEYKNEICEIINQRKSVIQIFYDIVKAHAEKIKVETKESKGTVFSVILGV